MSQPSKPPVKNNNPTIVNSLFFITANDSLRAFILYGENIYILNCSYYFMRVFVLCLAFLVGCVAELSQGGEIMKLTSPAFVHGGNIPSVHTCDGDDVSPVLAVLDVPRNAKSLVLIMDDPDAVKPAGKVWDHWVRFNIPVDTKEITGEPGVGGKGTSGNLGYKGPCPPDREHRYFFKLYALDTMLNLSEGSTKKQVEDAMKGHVLAEAVLMGRYERK